MRMSGVWFLLIGLALLAPRRALAEEDWTESRPEDLSRYSLSSIEFTGAEAFSEDDLRDAIKSSTSGILRFRPVDVERIEGDVIRLRNHLRRRGYWNARVTRRLLFDAQQRHTRAIFDIDAGPQRIVGSISVRGNLTYSAEEILSWTKLRSGEPFDIALADADRTSIENAYANEGFYQVRVVADIQPTADEESLPLVHDLIFRIEEGPRFFVGQIRVEGNRVTRAAIIRRELTLGTGDVMSREKLADSRSRLYGTGYFSRVDLLPRDPDPDQGTVDLLVRVEERKMRFIGAGIGYGTRDQLRVSTEWGHRNLWGTGRRATVRGILATELFPADLVRARVEGRLVEPWLFNTRTQGTMELYYERSREFFNNGTVEGEYDLNLVGLGLNINRRLTRYTRAWVTLQNEWADVDPGPVPLEDNPAPDVTRSVVLTAERDRRDDYFDPHKGFLHRGIVRLSGGPLGGDNTFWKASAESNWFRRVSLLTLAGRVRVGWERPFGQSDIVPDRDRFKLGGATTVRGYTEQEIGPGDFLILGNFEMRFPIVWLFGGAFFFDGGNAWERASDVRIGDFHLTDSKSDPDLAAETEVRYSAGAGLRLETPVGPVRFDYGRKLKILPVAPGGERESRGEFHLSLGHVF